VDGKVDYERCESKDFFKAGLARLVAAFTSGHAAAIMCSELDPERCHRSKLIGEALRKLSVPIQHIERDGSLSSQRDVIDRLTKGQGALFANGFTSRARYGP
jgi:uncharacterized protein (DUF488 family)